MPRWAAIAVGLVLGAAAALLISNRPETRQAAGPRPTQAVSEVDGSLAAVWLQYSAAAEAVVGTAQLDFLAGLPPGTASLWTVARGDESTRLAAFLRRAGDAAARATVVEVPGPLTPWTRDRALALARDGQLLLLVPPDPGESWPERQGDWHAAQWLASARPGTKVLELPIDFDAGDLILSDEVTLFDANLLAKNRGRGFASMADLAKAVASWTGRPALGLGENEGDVPRYHMAMYVLPLGGRRALVGDPTLARAITGPGWQPGDRSPDDDRLLLADDSTATQARFDRAAADVRARGWSVVRIPAVQFDDRTYLTYTNAVVEAGPRGRRVYLPHYAGSDGDPGSPLARLDAAGRAAWQQAGYAVVPIRVAGVWRHHGTIGCLVNVLWRGAEAPVQARAH
ncbi:MAG: hypothetical protein HY902_00705 [Deltaproteobacteria bacterium]|nr:hypothetical protein [Deltaproteobacteria bacterium]